MYYICSLFSQMNTRQIQIFFIYTTIGIVRCTLGLATDDLAKKPWIPFDPLRDNIGVLIFDLHGGC